MKVQIIVNLFVPNTHTYNRAHVEVYLVEFELVLDANKYGSHHLVCILEKVSL